jgi:hypothetical protein
VDVRVELPLRTVPEARKLILGQRAGGAHARSMGDVRVRVAACGSGARPLADRLGIPVQEVVANAIAVRALHPEACTAIELGGQDAKIVFFHRDEATGQRIASDMRMNGVCAGAPAPSSTRSRRCSRSRWRRSTAARRGDASSTT